MNSSSFGERIGQKVFSEVVDARRSPLHLPVTMEVQEVFPDLGMAHAFTKTGKKYLLKKELLGDVLPEKGATLTCQVDRFSLVTKVLSQH